jgi:hypothetical protein
MHSPRIRLALVVFFYTAMAFASTGAHALTNTLSVTLGVAGLPPTITLCRDPTAIQTFGVDEEWEVAIDVDNNPNTGQGGIDVILAVATPNQNYPCSPTSASTQQRLETEVAVWNSSQQTFIDSGQTATLALDFNAHTMTVITDVSGALAGLTTLSPIRAVSAGTYTSSANGPSFATDNAGPITVGNSIATAANNVQFCTAPCSTGASWYPLVDLVSLGAITAQPLPTPESPPAFGATTLDLEFDLVSLPTMVSLCNSSIFRTNPGYDLMWIAFANYNAAGGGVYETMIAAHTPLQPGCSTPSSAALASSVQTTVFHLDPNNIQNGYTYVEVLPVTVNTASGKIVVQANSTDPNLAGITSGTLREFTVEDAISSNNGDFSSIQLIGGLGATYPQDDTAQFNFSASFTDPAGDVCTSSSSCTSASYPIIDLTGGSAHMDDWIFRNGFE